MKILVQDDFFSREIQERKKLHFDYNECVSTFLFYSFQLLFSTKLTEFLVIDL